ncbi:MAG TPA: hypothetical protein VLW54_08600 [Candidatus Acidoferrales bacterium]|nr:hypothetical protein [Candidatus Acidoferrales bacterium]
MATASLLRSPRRLPRLLALAAALFLFSGLPSRLRAQEPPYLVTYSDSLEEPGNLEVAYKGVAASPRHANSFTSGTLELEYGATAWWTTELYLSGQSTSNDSAIFTGYRWENRFRPLLREHFINPILYIEYEHISEADRSLLEVVGHDSISDLRVPNAAARRIPEHSVELKLILSSYAKGWNFSENFIAEKSLKNNPWEFGYALAASRPLALKASPRRCFWCRQNFAAGVEAYGGLGDRYSFGWRQTSQYLGPAVSFEIPKGPVITFSPSFGLNANSVGVLYRFKVSYEIQQIFSRSRKAAR